MICAVIKGPSYRQAYEQMEKAKIDADLVELRLDLFDEINIEKLLDLKNTFSLPMLFTIRTDSQGGSYRLSKELLIKQLRLLAAVGPAYLDLEHDIPIWFIEELKEKHPKLKIILSYHDFSKTPSDIEALYLKMKGKKADMLKIALMANSTQDSLKFLSWTKEKFELSGIHSPSQGPEALIAISMGDQGQISRILAPWAGCPLTFASLDDHAATAPGQLTAQILKKRYHYHAINSTTRLYGLIGSPVSNSISDMTHNALFSQHRLNAAYVKLKVELPELEGFLNLAKTNFFKGLSVTMPLKEAIMPFLDEIDSHAKEIGAVNTLVFNTGSIKGYNTDGVGALNAIERHQKIKNKRVVILGAGGAAKAIAFEAHRRGGSLVIANRDVHKAQALAEKFGGQGWPLDNIEKCLESGYDILINSLPIDPQLNPHSISSQAIIMDIKTKPQLTKLLKAALEKQAKVVYGYEMFLEQALGQYDIWFKENLDINQCRRDLEHAIRHLA